MLNPKSPDPASSQVALIHEWHRDGVNHIPS
jgi:hypothetical protein